MKWMWIVLRRRWYLSSFQTIEILKMDRCNMWISWVKIWIVLSKRLDLSSFQSIAILKMDRCNMWISWVKIWIVLSTRLDLSSYQTIVILSNSKNWVFQYMDFMNWMWIALIKEKIVFVWFSNNINYKNKSSIIMQESHELNVNYVHEKVVFV